MEDGLTNPVVQQLAALGTHGEYPNTCYRDLRHKFPLNRSGIPEPLIVKLPMLNVKKIPPQVEEVNFPIV